jgi:hypothetical protein
MKYINRGPDIQIQEGPKAGKKFKHQRIYEESLIPDGPERVNFHPVSEPETVSEPVREFPSYSDIGEDEEDE